MPGLNPGLEYLSVFGLAPVPFVKMAAQLGAGHVSLNLGGPANCLAPDQPVVLRDNPQATIEVRDCLRGEGIMLSLAEGLAIVPERPVEAQIGLLDLAAELEARAICAVSLERDRDRTHAAFHRLSELASERGLLVTTEVGAGTIRNLEKAIAAADAVAHPAFGLLIDTMHFFRSGSTVEDLASLDSGILSHVQLCDVPMPATMDNYMEEALFERRAPGDGDLPLSSFLAEIPEGVPVGLEVPIRSEAERGIPHFDRLQRCLEQARSIGRGHGR